MTTDPEYVREVSSIRYGLNTDDMTKPKDKDKDEGQVESQVAIEVDYKTLSRI